MGTSHVVGIRMWYYAFCPMVPICAWYALARGAHSPPWYAFWRVVRIRAWCGFLLCVSMVQLMAFLLLMRFILCGDYFQIACTLSFVVGYLFTCSQLALI